MSVSTDDTEPTTVTLRPSPSAERRKCERPREARLYSLWEFFFFHSTQGVLSLAEIYSC